MGNEFFVINTTLQQNIPSIFGIIKPVNGGGVNIATRSIYRCTLYC